MVPKGFIRFEVMATIKGEDPEFYRKVQKGPFTWFVPNNGNPSKINWHNPRDENGYGGSVVKFPLEDGSICDVKGPWCRTADTLFEVTGIDLRNNHLTFGIIALERQSVKHKGMTNDYKGVLYVDEDETVGDFDRIPKLAQKMANERGENVVYQVITAGGGQLGTKRPEIEAK